MLLIYFDKLYSGVVSHSKMQMHRICPQTQMSCQLQPQTRQETSKYTCRRRVSGSYNWALMSAYHQWAENSNSQDPNGCRSRSGYVIFYSGCPIIWKSKLQTEIALSTTESEYISLSQSIRDLIPLREMLIENHQTKQEKNY